jgi:lipoprotein-releasing system ATP-binding protein
MDELVPLDKDGEHTRIRGDNIGFVFQFHFLLPEFSAAENVMLPMRKLGRLSPKEMEVRAAVLLEEVGLGDKTHRLPSQLSGGEQQRVAIARSLANMPGVLLADEPTGNLDVKNSLMVFESLTRLAKEKGQAVLIVTHNPELANKCDRILRMRDGLFIDS